MREGKAGNHAGDLMQNDEVYSGEDILSTT